MTRAKSALVRYGLAIVAFGATIGFSFAVKNTPLAANVLIAFLATLIVSAWYGGIGPALLVIALLEVIQISFGTPRPQFNLTQVFVELNRLGLFVILAALVSGRKKVENRLRQQREWLQVTLSSIADAVIATDVQGRVSLMNRTAEAIT